MKTSGMKMQMSEEAGQSGMRPGDKENKTGTKKEEGDMFRIEKGRPAARGSGAVWCGWKQITKDLSIRRGVGMRRQQPFFICLLQKSGLAAVHRKHGSVIHKAGWDRHIPDMLHIHKDPPVNNKETGIILQLSDRGFEGGTKTQITAL